MRLDHLLSRVDQASMILRSCQSEIQKEQAACCVLVASNQAPTLIGCTTVSEISVSLGSWPRQAGDEAEAAQQVRVGL